jgi:hypothetical protein
LCSEEQLYGWARRLAAIKQRMMLLIAKRLIRWPIRARSLVPLEKTRDFGMTK